MSLEHDMSCVKGNVGESYKSLFLLLPDQATREVQLDKEVCRRNDDSREREMNVP